MRMNGLAGDIKTPDAVGEFCCREADWMCGVADFVYAVRVSLAWMRWVREIQRRLAGAAPSVLPDLQLLDCEAVVLKAYVDGLPGCHCQTPKPKLPRVLFAGFVFVLRLECRSILAGAVGSAAFYAGALWFYAAVGDFDGVGHLACGRAGEGAPHAVDVDRLSGAHFTLDRDVHGREEFVA
jgi:hypothetical protein